MTTTKYEFDAVRWCRTMAKAHWQRNEHDISSTFRTVAEEIDRLRAENDALRNEARVYRAQCAMRDEWRDKIEGELATLKEVVAWIYRKNYALSKREIIERVNTLAALVGGG